VVLLEVCVDENEIVVDYIVYDRIKRVKKEARSMTKEVSVVVLFSLERADDDRCSLSCSIPNIDVERVFKGIYLVSCAM